MGTKDIIAPHENSIYPALMARSAMTLRLHAEEKLALEGLSKSEGRPMSQLLNDAVRLYLTHSGQRDRSLADSLDRLRAYREHDPHFQAAIASFAETEANLHDPLEDTVIRDPEEARAAATGPVQTRIHDLLRA